eukprot:CAMPEP_0170189270 /NCGR_PEP_ID=MMETSP0040_2-20121228/46418_1 /TAXON_ID=641309 /ORGANISM="Lotharella oceanica, Strain CCMP622" /LENGTH=109 /DNA_ID=CAMNT_0010436791 /DNA_START=72 /DNA_END=401 /DNA_ORIENTATION=-
MPNFATHIAQQIRTGSEITLAEINTSPAETRVVVYRGEGDYRSTANTLGIHTDFKNGDPRGSFGHVNLAYVNGKKTFVVDRRTLDSIQSNNQDWPYAWAGVSNVVRASV